MPDKKEHGKIALLGKGVLGVLKGGYVAVLNKDGRCETCCETECVPYVLAGTTTNSENPVWDLRPYQGPGKAKKGAIAWRLIERGYGLNYGSGTVNKDRQLVGLPDSFRTSYYYNGYMELQIACPDKYGNPVWPSLQ